MSSGSTLAKGGPALGRFVRTLPVIVLAPVLTLLVLAGWALSSPVGSSPDDDFHLASIWCAAGTDTEHCQPGSTAVERTVPEGIVAAPCFAFKPEISGECQATIDFDPASTVVTERFNAFGGYPPVYYTVMNTLIGDDIQASIVTMRFVNALIFVVLATTLFLLLPARRRPTLIWAWVITTVPLGLFVLASNNPSSWAIMGVGFSWIALLGYFETAGWRKGVLAGLFVLSAVMAAGSRGDAALYTVLGIAAVLFLTFRMRWRYAVEAILPVIVAVLCVLMFRFSRPIEAVTQGVTGGGSGGGGGRPEPVDLFSQFAANLLETPFLWIGIFGKQWGLGWLDTSVPAVVWAGAFASFIAVGFVAARYMDARKLMVLIGGGILLWIFPALFLLGTGDSVGENMQPRYLLPLIVLFAGVLMLSPGFAMIRLTRAQSILVWATLTVSQAVALQLNLQRYVHGTDNLNPNLNSAIEWWWPAGPSPMTVWVLTSLAFSILVAVVLRYTRVTVAEPETTVRSSVPAVAVGS